MSEDLKISGAILAGGKSSRFGADKGLIHFNGKPLVEHVLEQLLPICDEVFIVSNNPAYKYLNLPVYQDEYLDAGPLGGLHSALINCSNMHCLVAACDMPFLNKPLFESLINHSNYEAVIPLHDNRPEPLCGLYQQITLVTINEQLELGHFKMTDAIERLYHYYLEVGENDDFYHPQLFANINTKEQWQNLK